MAKRQPYPDDWYQYRPGETEDDFTRRVFASIWRRQHVGYSAEELQELAQGGAELPLTDVYEDAEIADLLNRPVPDRHDPAIIHQPDMARRAARSAAQYAEEQAFFQKLDAPKAGETPA